MFFLALNSFKKFHGKFKERAAKKEKREKRNTNTKRVALAYALLNSDRESCYWTRKIIMVFY